MNQNQNASGMSQQQMPQSQQNAQLTNSNAPIVTGFTAQQPNARQLPLQQPSQQMQQPALQTLQPSLQQSAQQDYTGVQNANTVPQPPAPPIMPIAQNQPTAQQSGQQGQQGVPSSDGLNQMQTVQPVGTTDQGAAFQSIIDQQQAQIDALMAQNAALNGQITQMVQNGAQFSQQVQQPVQQVQQPMQVFDPPSLASDDDWSVAALAKDIGTKQHRHSKQ